MSTPPPHGVDKSQFHWLESQMGSSSTAAPHPSRRMTEVHQPMGCSFVAHGGDRTPSPVHKSSEFLQPQQRGNDNDDLPGRYTSPHGVSTRLLWLISRDWLVGFDPISSQFFRPSRVFSHSSRIRQTFAMRTQFNELFICIIGRMNK